MGGVLIKGNVLSGVSLLRGSTVYISISLIPINRLFQWPAGGLSVHVDLQLDLSCDYLAVPWSDGSEPLAHLLCALHLVSDQQGRNCHLLVRDSGQGTHANIWQRVP